ncbi:MAG: polyphosphate kinase [Acidobacteriota bacterium]
MLESISLDRELAKKDYKASLPPLQTRLFELQRACWRGGLASLLVIEGWDASGKGSLIRKFTERLEPRGFDLHYTREARSAEAQLPWMWRFWQRLPAYGRMAIFDQSWYSRLFRARTEYGASRAAWRRGIEDIVDFERMLTDDRHVVVKLFLHFERDEKKKRLEELTADPHESWKVNDATWKAFEAWNQYVEVISETLAATDSAPAPWTLLAATDKRWMRVRAFEAVCAALERGLRARELPLPEDLDAAAQRSGEDS